MKKLMTFVCVAAFAAVTQAASINWGGGIAKGDGSTALGANSMAYLIYSTSDIFGGAPTQFDTTTGLTDLGGKATATYTITATDAGNWFFSEKFIRADTDGGVNGYWQIVIVDADNPTQFAHWHTQIAGISDSTGAGDATHNLDWAGSGWLGDNFQPTVVPEPTSMALLALGVAALGLRRKVRK